MTTQLIEQIELFSEAEQQDLEFSPEELVKIESELEYSLESIRCDYVFPQMEAYLQQNIPESDFVNERILKIFTPLIQKSVQKIAKNPQMSQKLRAACEKKDSDTTTALSDMLVPLLTNMLPGYLSWMASRYCLPVVRALGISICKEVGASKEALVALECGCCHPSTMPSPSPKPSPHPHSKNTNDYEKRVIELTNKERRKYRLPLLRHNDKLAAAAKKHTMDMVRHRFLSHRGRDGSTLTTRVKAVGYPWRSLAENIAKGQRTPEKVVRDWMNSSGHRRNILGSKHREIGVCYSNRYWTQVFGSRR